MPTITKMPHSNGVTSGTPFSNPTNAYVNDGNLATVTSTAKNTTVTEHDWGFPGITTGEIPDGSTIDAVRIVARVGLTGTGTNVLVGLNGTANGSVDNGTEQTHTTANFDILTYTYNNLPNLADLRTADFYEGNVRYRRGNTTTSITAQVDYLMLEVDYTPGAATETGDFALDSVVLREQAGSATFDSIMHREQAGSLALDSIVLVSVEGQFGLDSALVGDVSNPVWTTPADMEQVPDLTPTLAFLSPESVRPQHYEINLDTNGSFNTEDLYVYRSFPDPSGWEFFDGIDWEPLPATGLDPSDAGAEVRFTVPIPLTAGTWFRRVRASI